MNLCLLQIILQIKYVVGDWPFKYKGWKFDQKMVTPIWIKRPDTHLNKKGPYIGLNGVMGRTINGQQSMGH